MSFWEVLWLIIVSFAFVAYLLLLFHILADLFRDTETSGWVKAVWVVFLIFLPLITALIYLIARGPGMQRRAADDARQLQEAEATYIRQTAGTNPATQIADAGKLLDAGVISQQEFDQLKSKALS